MFSFDITLTIDDKNYVRSLGNGLIEFVKDEYIPSIGFFPGAFEIDDIVIITQKNYELYKDLFYGRLFEDTKLLQNILKDNFIFLSVFGRDDFQTIFKTSKNEVELDTIFNGKSIKAKLSQNNHFYLTIDNSNYTFNLSGKNQQIISYQDGKLKFFIPHTIDDSDYKKIVNEMRCPGYFNNHFFTVNNVTPKELFIKEFYKCIEEIITLKNQELLSDVNGKTLLFQKRQGIKNSVIDVYSKELCEQRITKYGHALEKIEEYKVRSDLLEYDFYNIIGQSISIKKVKKMLSKAADKNATILLLGESGTGKTFFAQEIHNKSKRCSMPFVVVNCAAIPKNLIESELFGYEEGAFTGARKSGKKGYFELADGGTIFLDEIGELPLPSQGILLEVLQNQSFYRVGGNKKINVNVRIIAATNQKLEELVEEKKFRKDLFYRLNVFPITIPPLRERPEDIDLLCKKILPKVCKRLEIEPLVIREDALAKLKKHRWPGNVRELENILEQASILCEGRVIKPEHIIVSKDNSIIMSELDLKQKLEEYEKGIIKETLLKYNYNKTKTIKALGISRTNLFEKIKKYGL